MCLSINRLSHRHAAGRDFDPYMRSSRIGTGQAVLAGPFDEEWAGTEGSNHADATPAAAKVTGSGCVTRIQGLVFNREGEKLNHTYREGQRLCAGAGH